MVRNLAFPTANRIGERRPSWASAGEARRYALAVTTSSVYCLKYGPHGRSDFLGWMFLDIVQTQEGDR
jgi:hypothetical protein